MMQRNVRALIIAGMVSVMAPAAIFAQATSPCARGGIAFVQGAAILSSIPAYVQAESLLAKDVDSYRAEMAKLSSGLDSEVQAFQDKQALLSPTVKASETKRLQDKQASIQAHGNDLEQKAGQRRQELLKPIEDRVQEVLDGIRAEYDCAVIFDANAQASNIASINKSLDLTQRVIDRLKSGAPIPAATPAKPPVKPPTGIKQPAGAAPIKP